jgi:hypothetical protein
MTVMDENAPKTLESMLKALRADEGTRTPEAVAFFKELKAAPLDDQLEVLLFGQLMLSRRLEYYVQTVEKNADG